MKDRIDSVKVSFVIPNYEGEGDIRKCLDSVFSQTYKNFEVIVYDNGSLDNSPNIIKDEYPSVNLVISIENTGVCNALNESIKLSKGEYIAVIHADTVLDKFWLEKSVSAIEQNERIFSSVSLIMDSKSPDEIQSAGLGITYGGKVYRRLNGKTVKALKIKNKNGSNKTGEAIAGSTLYKKKVVAPHNAAALYRKRHLNMLGLFDKTFFVYFEDADIGFRALLRGFYNVFCHDAIAYHTGFCASGQEESDFSVRLMTRNKLYIRYKNFSPFMRLKTYIWHCFSNNRAKAQAKKNNFETVYNSAVSEAKNSKKRLASKEYRYAGLFRKIKILWILFWS